MKDKLTCLEPEFVNDSVAQESIPPVYVAWWAEPVFVNLFKGTVSWDRFQNFWQKFTELGLTKGRGWFLNFLEAPVILKRKKYIYCG